MSKSSPAGAKSIPTSSPDKVLGYRCMRCTIPENARTTTEWEKYQAYYTVQTPPKSLGTGVLNNQNGKGKSIDRSEHPNYPFKENEDKIDASRRPCQPAVPQSVEEKDENGKQRPGQPSLPDQSPVSPVEAPAPKPKKLERKFSQKLKGLVRTLSWRKK
ncbi:hypothetical protein SBOR_9841 [Sclerotinia borealis F-4128]|uniref:Uncharacterized protein n=1 Tax=Sclerotinia borealis (strain F-4128) TaxID=1432307 RepID=W9C4C1_SCLBF|nr:hypothetical protein SBOR_9841 [Sclerotinia borealis F-4128]